jgi:hypothetical protein
MDLPTTLSIAALAVSTASSAFSFYQARAARRQAEAAVEQAEAATSALEIERRRWVVERTPILDGVVEFVQPSGHLLHLRLLSSKAVTVIRERILGDSGVNLHDLSTGEVTARVLKPGDSLQRWVSVSDPPPSDVKLEVICEAELSSDHWAVLLDVPVFPELGRRLPAVALHVEPCYPPPHRLTLKLKSLEPLRFLEASIDGGRGVHFLAASGATSPDRMTTRCHDLAPGSVARWPIEIASVHSDTISLTLKCVGPNSERWDLHETVDIPPDLLTPQPPQFSVGVRREGRDPVLVLSLDSRWPLASIEAHVSNLHNSVAFTGTDGRLGTAVKRGRTEPGDTFRWRLELRSIGSIKVGFFALDMTCTGLEGEVWSFHRTVGVPGYL